MINKFSKQFLFPINHIFNPLHKILKIILLFIITFTIFAGASFIVYQHKAIMRLEESLVLANGVSSMYEEQIENGRDKVYKILRESTEVHDILCTTWKDTTRNKKKISTIN